jgi:hypothetical protein
MVVNYTGLAGFGVALQFTPDTGGPATSIEAILDVAPPAETAESIKFTPLDGDDAGKEKVIPGKDIAQQATAKVTYNKTRHAALSALRRVLGTWVMTAADGATITGHGFMSKVAVDSLSDTALMTSSLTFEIDGGFVFAAGGGA